MSHRNFSLERRGAYRTRTAGWLAAFGGANDANEQGRFKTIMGKKRKAN
ncbi:MAG: hypothetical protein SVW57_07085 [Thermodesulfobacteriota bacterium]|nr:hypothetical protein [Thermodesulfobacteriota bacterium]